MGCSTGLARILVFVANFAFLLVGLALLVVGVFYKVNFTAYTDAIPADYDGLQYVPTLSIIVGVIIFFIAFLGCCGALKRNTCMLTWYGAILIVIFLLQIGLAIFGFVQISDKNDLEMKVRNQLTQLFQQYESRKGAAETVDIIQQSFQCCGPESSSYWQGAIPPSCYPDNRSSTVPFARGCNSIVPEYLWTSIKGIAIGVLVISVVEVIGAVLSLCLSGSIREKRRQDAFY